MYAVVLTDAPSVYHKMVENQDREFSQEHKGKCMLSHVLVYQSHIHEKKQYNDL
jgi:hypothetical protein